MEDNKEMTTVETNDYIPATEEETEENHGGNGGLYLLIGGLIGAGAYALGRKAVGKLKEYRSKVKNRSEKEPEKLIDVSAESESTEEEAE